jgi:predicted transposase YbfD/YdcC
MQVGRVTRIRTHKKSGKTTIERVCFITSVPESYSTAEQLLALNRGHWTIENSLHRVKDTVLREDQSTLRTGQAPRVASTFRNLTVTLIKKHKLTPTEGREYFNHRKNKAINATKIT